MSAGRRSTHRAGLLQRLRWQGGPKRSRTAARNGEKSDTVLRGIRGLRRERERLQRSPDVRPGIGRPRFRRWPSGWPLARQAVLQGTQKSRPWTQTYRCLYFFFTIKGRISLFLTYSGSGLRQGRSLVFPGSMHLFPLQNSPCEIWTQYGCPTTSSSTVPRALYDLQAAEVKARSAKNRLSFESLGGMGPRPIRPLQRGNLSTELIRDDHPRERVVASEWVGDREITLTGPRPQNPDLPIVASSTSRR